MNESVNAVCLQDIVEVYLGLDGELQKDAK